jgi:hypothetical protein
MSNEELLAQNVGMSGLVRPVITEENSVSPPENSEVRKVAEDVLQAAQYTFAAVAADPARNVQPNSLASAFRDALQEMSGERREQLNAQALKLVQMPEEARKAVFGRYGVMDAESLLSKGFEDADSGLPDLQINRKLLGVSTPKITIPNMQNVRATDQGLLIPRADLPANFEHFAQDWEEARAESLQTDVFSDHLEEIWGPSYREDPFAASMTDFEEFEEQAPLDKLGFYITEIKCVDETAPEWWGHDEIAIAGISVDETGDTKRIGERFVGGGFDDGDRKRYRPHWRYTWFNMREGSFWPKRYTMTLLLAEKDHGGLSSVLNTVWSRIKNKVKALIEKAVAGLLSSWVGPAIASAIGKAVAWVVDKLFGWIINAFKDDVFPPMIRSIRVPSLHARWNYSNGRWGSPVSPRGRIHTYGHGGHYSIEYYWRMYS